jgi:hypothetical protein
MEQIVKLVKLYKSCQKVVQKLSKVVKKLFKSKKIGQNFEKILKRSEEKDDRD